MHQISCTGTTYTVNLLDHSNFFPATPITSYTLYEVGNATPLQSGSTATNYTTTSLSVGTHYFHLVISRSGWPSCDAYDTVDIPALPSAAFSPSLSTPCVVTAVVSMSNTSTPAPPPSVLTYAWDFGDFSTNSQFQPQHSYSATGVKPIQLTVTNQYGCTSTVSHSVTVGTNPLLSGFINASPSGTPCAGTPVTLSWTGSSGSPSVYNWTYNSVPFSTASSVNVFNAGSYVVEGSNVNGCRRVTPALAISFTVVPHPVITGNPSQCVGNTFTLDGYAGSDPTYQYQWYLNGSAMSGETNPSLTQTINTTGTYNYKLKITVPNGAGYCDDTSTTFTVTVYNPSPDPTITYSMLDCNTYNIELDGSNAGYTGTYNWSNGQSGATVYTYTGGPYRLWFTDTHGCVSHTDVDVPKDPRNYMWMFPTGCYTLCDQALTSSYILGPIQFFNYWAYLRNGSPDLSNVNSSPYNYPYYIPGPGTYNLELNNGLCDDISDPMDVTVIHCASCTDVLASVVNVWKTYNDFICRDSIEVQFNNLFGMSVNYNISAIHGSILYGAGNSMPAGVSNAKYRYVANPGFSGPIDTLVIKVTTPTGSVCYLKIPFSITPCANSYARFAPNGVNKHFNSWQQLSRNERSTEPG